MSAETIDTIAVLGLGTMGHGIAQSFAAAGYQVRCYDQSDQTRETLPDRVRANLLEMAKAGVGTRASVDPTLARISVVSNVAEAVGPAQFVTEAVAEDLAIKQNLFVQLESHVAATTILASNSSSFPISQTGEKMQRPERAIVTHWFNPPHIVPVVEVVPGARTANETCRETLQLLQRIGKTPVHLRQEIPGFLVNRVQIAMYREIWDLLSRGIADPEEIDLAIRGSMGFRLAAIGPLQVNDFAGLDVTGRVYENLVPEIRSDTTLPSAIRQLVEEGRFGVKTGQGIFEYTPQIIEEKQSQRDLRYLALIKLLEHTGAS